MKASIIINKKSGNEKSEDTPSILRRTFKKLDIEIEIYEVTEKDIHDKTRTAIGSDSDIIIAAGGDGTISTVAEEMLDIDKPLGILPAGTFNHFAKDLNIPLDLDDAAIVISKGRTRQIDVAEVNGRIFVNNSSVGLYPKSVKVRKHITERLGGSKWIAMVIAALAVFTRFPLFNIRLTTPKESFIRKTPFVFIGNNEYKIDLLNLGKRESLTSGKLSLYTAHISGRMGALKIAFMALINMLKPGYFDIHFLEELVLESKRKVVHVSLDGEIFKMRPPLKYRIRPGELKVIVPGDNAA